MAAIDAHGIWTRVNSVVMTLFVNTRRFVILTKLDSKKYPRTDDDSDDEGDIPLEFPGRGHEFRVRIRCSKLRDSGRFGSMRLVLTLFNLDQSFGKLLLQFVCLFQLYILCVTRWGVQKTKTYIGTN